MSKRTIVAMAAGVAVLASAAVVDFVAPKIPGVTPGGTMEKTVRYALAFGVGFGAVFLAEKYLAS